MTANEFRKLADDFTRAYAEAALWSSADSEGNPLDKDYSFGDFAPETLDCFLRDCRAFQDAQGELISPENCETRQKCSVQAGHDFWLTRNGHGAGFWDGDWCEPAATALTEAAHAAGSCELYVGDDGRIYS